MSAPTLMDEGAIRRAIHDRYKAKCTELAQARVELACVKQERDWLALRLSWGSEMRGIAEAIVRGEGKTL